MKSKKINIEIAGIKYELPAEALRTKDYWGKEIEPTIYARGPIAGSLVKQFVKAKYPKVVCSVKSSSFANGNSLDVYVSYPNGDEVESNIFSEINAFANQFEYGRYNGWDETYDFYENSGCKTNKGTIVEAGVKYVHVNNRPSFGTTPDVVRMLKAMMAGEYVWGKISLEEAIMRVKTYKVSESNINKALPYLA